MYVLIDNFDDFDRNSSIEISSTMIQYNDLFRRMMNKGMQYLMSSDQSYEIRMFTIFGSPYDRIPTIWLRDHIYRAIHESGKLDYDFWVVYVDQVIFCVYLCYVRKSYV